MNAFLDTLTDQDPLFVLAMGNTETGKIPGISAAGANPELTDYTPPADGELLLHGKCRSIDGVPITPDGIPTPAVISRAALNLLGTGTLLVDAGLNVTPEAPRVTLGGKAGGDIREATPVPYAEETYENARTLGKHLSRSSRPLVIGESIAGGTTTALGVLTALGYDAPVSSSLPENPLDLKREVVTAGLETSGMEPGEADPLEAVKEMGDPVIAAAAGLATGSETPVLLAGGTQMAAVAAVLARLDALDDVAIGTTRWILNDSSSDIEGLAAEIGVDLHATTLSFADTDIDGLRVYEQGVVKEGVGAGGLALVAEESVGRDAVQKETERVYRDLKE